MSYLAAVRLHFKGRFVANVPTGNNNIRNIRNPNPSSEDLGANPGGDGSFRISECKVTAAFAAGKRVKKEDDDILACDVIANDDNAFAKLAELDPQYPWTTCLFGLRLRIHDPIKKRTFLSGICGTTSIADFFPERTPGALSDDEKAGAIFQTTIEVLEWGDPKASDWLRALFDESRGTNMLSIKFNVDRFEPGSKDHGGRIVGTIGPAYPNEPRRFVRGRHLLDTGRFINHSVAVIDEKNGQVRLDIGMAFPVNAWDGAFADCGDAILRYRPAGKDPVEIGPIPYLSEGCYDETAGIVDIPFSSKALDEIGACPLEIYTSLFAGDVTVVNREATNGVYIRSDRSACWLSPGEQATAEIYASQFGKALPNALIYPRIESRNIPLMGGPALGEPSSALSTEVTVTDEHGRAYWTLHAKSPGRPREWFGLDGQIYPLRWELKRPELRLEIKPGEYFHVKIWDDYSPPSPITWPTVECIFRYYEKLFPLKTKLHLTDRDAVITIRSLLLKALTRDFDAAGFMPVSRDLSPAKQRAIISWLRSLPESAPDAKPSHEYMKMFLASDEAAPARGGFPTRR